MSTLRVPCAAYPREYPALRTRKYSASTRKVPFTVPPRVPLRVPLRVSLRVPHEYPCEYSASTPGADRCSQAVSTWKAMHPKVGCFRNRQVVALAPRLDSHLGSKPA
jgi:hypothetical protein